MKNILFKMIILLILILSFIDTYSQTVNRNKLREKLFGRFSHKSLIDGNSGKAYSYPSMNIGGVNKNIANSGNIKVNDDNSLYGANHSWPYIVVSKTGTALVMWVDLRNGRNDLYGQLYGINNKPIGSNFLINNAANKLALWGHCAAADNSGNFLIMWINSNFKISLQRIDAQGNLIGSNYTINSTSSNITYPAIQFEKNGNYAISWHSDSQYYARILDSSGQSITGDILIEGNTKYSYSNSIIADSSGNFGFAYSAQKSGKLSIYFKYFTGLGAQIGNELKITSDTLSGISVMPLLISSKNGNILVSWQQQIPNSNYFASFYSQIINPVSGLIGNNFKPFGDFNLAYFYPLASSDNENNFYVVSLFENDLKITKISNDGKSISNTTLSRYFANYHNGESWAMAFNAADNSFIMSWGYNITGRNNVYLQKTKTNFEKIDSELSVPVDKAGAWQTYPKIAHLSNGNYLVAWVDQREGPYSIYGQLFNSNDVPLGNNFKMVSNITYLDDMDVIPFDMAADPNDIIYLLYKAAPAKYDPSYFTLQTFDKNGAAKGGTTVLKNSSVTYVYDFKLFITDKSDIAFSVIGEVGSKMAIVVYSYRNGILYDPLEAVYEMYSPAKPEGKEVYSYCINNNLDALMIYKTYKVSGDTAYLNGKCYYGQYMYQTGKLGNYFLLDSLKLNHDFIPVSTFDNSNNFIICWNGYENYSYDRKIFFQKIASDNSIYKSDIVSASQLESEFILRDNDDNFVMIGWNDGNYYASRVSKGLAIDTIPQFLFSSSSWKNFSFQYSGGKTYWVWNDALTDGTGMDIYLGTNLKFVNSIPKSSRSSILFNSYPNPFNASTMITYSIPNPSQVTLCVYNSIGQEVARLVDKYQTEGYYKLSFNARNLPSGVYFIQLNTSYSTTAEKTILLK
jgi:hypothetical protein